VGKHHSRYEPTAITIVAKDLVLHVTKCNWEGCCEHVEDIEKILGKTVVPDVIDNKSDCDIECESSATGLE
jgi:hypothetical protein